MFFHILWAVLAVAEEELLIEEMIGKEQEGPVSIT